MGKLLLVFSAGFALGLLAISPGYTLIEPNVIKYAEYLDFLNVPANADLFHGPHYGVLQLAPYLDSTNPAGQLVCVGWMRADFSEGACTFLPGSGSGSFSPAGDMYDWWGNWAGITIDIHGHATITSN